MKNENDNCSISANITANEAFKNISKVTEWRSKNIDGKTEKLNDVFTYNSRDTWVTFKITDVVDNKKIVLHVTDCYLPQFKDKTEWKNTKVVFEISGNGNTTQINFTHTGLVPEVECYNAWVKGWTQYEQAVFLALACVLIKTSRQYKIIRCRLLVFVLMVLQPGNHQPCTELWSDSLWIEIKQIIFV